MKQYMPDELKRFGGPDDEEDDDELIEEDAE